MMSYWTFSDVFEEQGVVKTPFYGGYGLIAAGDIPKPAYDAFQLLHKLGDQRIVLDSESALLTRKADGSLVLAVWDYAPPEETGSSRTVTVRFKNTNPRDAVIWRLDNGHGDFHPLYKKMGEPRYPTAEQMQLLRNSAALTPEKHALKHGELTISVPAHGLAVVEVR
jgi:xylan 1,4-beta-xylosidase